MKILIVDDEMLARERLVSLLSELDNNFSVIEAEHGIEALKLIGEETPELVLLDIRMPVMDGLEVAHHLAGLDTPPAIIFTTAYQDYALDAFDAHAVDYLMKPIRKERLQQAIGRAKALNRSNISELRDDHPNNCRSHLSMTAQGNLQIVPIEKIYYLKADQKYVTAVWPEGELLIDDSLKSLEQEFPSLFIRIHRNTLVALSHILGLDKDEGGNPCIVLQGIEARLPVSRRHVSHVRKALKHL
ncbi:MAG: LytR/AlgR family response regulator transcription factor [Gammaproteobacteria bacterium]